MYHLLGCYESPPGEERPNRRMGPGLQEKIDDVWTTSFPITRRELIQELRLCENPLPDKSSWHGLSNHRIIYVYGPRAARENVSTTTFPITWMEVILELNQTPWWDYPGRLPKRRMGPGLLEKIWYIWTSNVWLQGWNLFWSWDYVRLWESPSWRKLMTWTIQLSYIRS